MNRIAKGALSVFLAGSMLLGEAAASVTAVPVWAAEEQTTAEEEK